MPRGMKLPLGEPGTAPGDHAEKTAMNTADELAKLHALRASGAINDDEYVLAKAKVLSQQPEGPAPSVPAPDAQAPFTRSLTKSSADRILGGVCGGLGRYTGVPSWIWRIGFCVAVLSFGVGLIPYVLLWIFMPAEAAG